MAKRRQTSKSSQKSKKILDRISALPLAVLHHLLLFFPVEDIVRTCALSKQWRTVWCSIHSLDLNKDLISSKKIKFHDFVDNLLLLRDGSDIHKFQLFIEYGDGESEGELGRNRINKWIMYAIRHNVKVIDIGFAGEDVELTQIFACQSLRELKLSFTYLHLPTPIYLLPFLKSLHLCEIDVQDVKLGKTQFSQMPMLETLIIEYCIFSVQDLLIISIVRLKTLVLVGDLPKSVEITARNLSSLAIGPCKSGSPNTVKFKTELTSLMCASIMLDATCFEPITKIFEILQHTQFLTLSDFFISDHFTDDDEDYEEHDVWFVYELVNLKCLTIQDFQGSVNEVRLVQVVMERASSLEKLIILTSKTDNEKNQEMKRIGKKVIAFPRASASVANLFQ